MSKLHRETPARAWARIRRRILDRDGWRCGKCGRPGRLEVHHRLTLKEGGTNTDENLYTLCRDCHIDEHRPKDSAWDSFLEELTSQR